MWHRHPNCDPVIHKWQLIYYNKHSLYLIAFWQIAKPTFTSLHIQHLALLASCHIRVNDDNYLGQHSHRTIFLLSSFDEHCLLALANREAAFQNWKLLALTSRLHLFHHHKGCLTPFWEQIIPPLMICIYCSHGEPI